MSNRLVQRVYTRMSVIEVSRPIGYKRGGVIRINTEGEYLKKISRSV